MPTPDELRRINITIAEDQYRALNERSLNVSGLIRDLLGDYLAANKITLQVSDETRRIYDLVVSNTGSSDEEIETPFREALASVLETRIEEMQALHARLRKDTRKG